MAELSTDRTPAQWAWLAAAAVLLLTLVLGGGWLAWRGLTATDPPPLGPAANAGPSMSAAGSPAVFGVPTVVDGVPWGFPLTPQGAAAAAVTAVTVTGQPDVVFDPDRFAEVAAVVFTAQQAAVQARQVDAARTELEASGWGAQPASRRMYYLTPLAVRLADYDADRPSATVQVWAMSLVGVGDAGGAVFTTSTVELVADEAGGTWTVAGLDTVEGPTPLVAATATAPGRTRALVRDAVPVLPLPLTVGPTQ